MVAGIRRLLAEVMETCDIDDYAQARLAEIEAALGTIDWDDAVVDLAEDNAATAILLRRALEWIDNDPLQHQDVALDRPALEDVLAGADASIEPFAVHNSRYSDCQAAAVHLAAHLADWVDDRPEDFEARSLLADFRDHYSSRFRDRRRGAARQKRPPDARAGSSDPR